MLCEIKGTDQLHGNRAGADRRLCFRYIDSRIALLPEIQNFKPLVISCSCTVRFVSDLVGNLDNRISRDPSPSGALKMAEHLWQNRW